MASSGEPGHGERGNKVIIMAVEQKTNPARWCTYDTFSIDFSASVDAGWKPVMENDVKKIEEIEFLYIKKDNLRLMVEFQYIEGRLYICIRGAKSEDEGYDSQDEDSKTTDWYQANVSSTEGEWGKTYTELAERAKEIIEAQNSTA